MHIVECLTNSTLGGAQMVVFTLIDQLLKLQPSLHFTVALPAGGVYCSRFRAAGVQVLELPMNELSLHGLRRTRNALRSLKPDVVHSHGKGAGLYARMLPKNSVAARRVHSYHGFHVPKGVLGRAYLAGERRLLRVTNEVIAVSESEARELRTIFPDDLPRVSIIPNVVNCEALRDANKDVLPAEHSDFFARNGGKFLVLMIARDDPVKNYPLALKAARKLLTAEHNVAFVFVGNEAAARVLSEYSSSVLGVPHVDNPAPFLRRANVVMLTSTKESSPLVIQEAYCFGKPVVATNVEGIRENVANGVNGLLCEENAECIAQALASLQSNAAFYDQLSRGALKSAAGSNVAAWALRYAEVYTGRPD